MPANRVFVVLRVSLLLCLVWAFLSTHSTGQQASNAAARWWKGNLHTHTFWSDGDAFPETVAEWYREQGYHFLAFTEHNVIAQGDRWLAVAQANRIAGLDVFSKYLARYGPSWVETKGKAGDLSHQVRLKSEDEVRALVQERGRFLLLPGQEITGSSADGHALHMNAINLQEALPMEAASTLRESLVRNHARVIAAAQRSGRPVHFHVNHPNYKWGVTAEDLAAVLDLQFFEVWNGVETDNDPGDATRPGTDEMWDIANTLRIVKYGARPLFALATDDAHDHHGNKTRAVPGRAWIMVQAAHLTPDSLLAAIRRGDFYATTGVGIRTVHFDRGARMYSLRLEIRPGEVLTTQFIGTRRGASIHGTPRLDAAGQPLESTFEYRGGTARIGEVFAASKDTNPSYVLRGDELYVRAVVTSNLAPAVPSEELKFQRAWTQPVGW